MVSGLLRRFCVVFFSELAPDPQHFLFSRLSYLLLDCPLENSVFIYLHVDGN